MPLHPRDDFSRRSRTNDARLPRLRPAVPSGRRRGRDRRPGDARKGLATDVVLFKNLAPKRWHWTFAPTRGGQEPRVTPRPGLQSRNRLSQCHIIRRLPPLVGDAALLAAAGAGSIRARERAPPIPNLERSAHATARLTRRRPAWWLPGFPSSGAVRVRSRKRASHHPSLLLTNRPIWN
jgi:hypothetical protein